MKQAARIRHALAAASIAWLTACAPLAEKPEPPAPRITEAQLRQRAQERLALGMRQYQSGEFEQARGTLAAALDHGLLSKSEQSGARKHLAFIHCMQDREPECRDEFRKALEIDPAFDLATAEAGHPIWGPVYGSVRAELRGPAPAPAAKKEPRSVAQQLLEEGLAKYNAGDFAGAAAALQSAVKEGLAALNDRLNAHKHVAFSLCLLNRFTSCRAEFARIFEIDPDFELTAAESGHPSWRRTYENALRRAQAGRKK